MQRRFPEKLRRPNLVLVLSFVIKFKKTVWDFFFQYKWGKNYKVMLINAGLSKLKPQDGEGMAYW